MDVLKQGQSEGLFYFMTTGEQPFPEYVKDLQFLEGFDAFYETNETLKSTANDEGGVSYMVELPQNYDPKQNYPLVMVLHGGIGSIQDSQYYYDFNAEEVNEDVVIAYFQGSGYAGAFSRVFADDVWKRNLEEGVKEIVANYSVDSSTVILAGPSMGGMCSIELARDSEISVRGLLLCFPVVPSSLKTSDYETFKQLNPKVVMICGESDWGFQGQKAFWVEMEKHCIPNRTLIFPELGHEFPENWSHHLKTSLEYLLNEN